MAEPATQRGRETRERIVISADHLFLKRGVSATSVDEILAAAEAGKGQFYRYFESKEALVAVVAAARIEDYLAPRREAIEQVETWEELESYLGDLVAGHRGRTFLGGCPVGSLALELAGQDDALCRPLAEALAGWQASLVIGLERLAERGLLRADADPERVAASLLATVQGAYLLSTVHRDSGVMATALEEALAHARAHPPAPSGEPSLGGTS